MRASTKYLALAGAGAAAMLFAGSASAANLVTNGGFETNGGNGQVGYNTTISGWSVPSVSSDLSYVFVFNASGTATSGTSADVVGSTSGQYGALNLWGPDDGSSNGLTLSPNGGAFIGADPVFQDGAITQTLTGLTPGASYVVSFDYAGAEQYDHTGGTSEGWQVGFGSDPTQSTALLSIGSKGFSGWETDSFTFTADSTSDVLSFLAIGTGTTAEPPFALLDGVSVTPAVPEPATWAMMLMGIGGLGAALRMRRRQQFAAA